MLDVFHMKRSAIVRSPAVTEAKTEELAALLGGTVPPKSKRRKRRWMETG